ncbi:MAG TPA: hypothetical protein VLA93_18650 [Pyrinomonadaceae bacterium]|nr:hypothetical protein [Pyrinomonadaceae bacterium]
MRVKLSSEQSAYRAGMRAARNILPLRFDAWQEQGLAPFSGSTLVPVPKQISQTESGSFLFVRESLENAVRFSDI